MFHTIISIILGLMAICPGHSLPTLEKRQETCSDLFPLTTYYNKEYFFASACGPGTNVDWEEAYRFCFLNKMTLAEIPNQDVSSALDIAIRMNPYTNGQIYWTGANVVFNQSNSVLPDGAWQWSDTGKQVDPSAWGPNEPNRLHYTVDSEILYENCGQFTYHLPGADGKYGLNDAFCTGKHNLICERPLNGQTTATYQTTTAHYEPVMETTTYSTMETTYSTMETTTYPTMETTTYPTMETTTYPTMETTMETTTYPTTTYEPSTTAAWEPVAPAKEGCAAAPTGISTGPIAPQQWWPTIPLAPQGCSSRPCGCSSQCQQGNRGSQNGMWVTASITLSGKNRNRQ